MGDERAPDELTQELKEKLFDKTPEEIRVTDLKTGAETTVYGVAEAEKYRISLMGTDPTGIYLFSKKCPYPDNCQWGNEKWHDHIIVANGKTYLEEKASAQLLMGKYLSQLMK